jgi:hypothetical protein
MEISREIHWRSPKDAITPVGDFVEKSCGGGWPSEAVGGKTRVVDRPLARLQCWMRSTQTRNIRPAQKIKYLINCKQKEITDEKTCKACSGQPATRLKPNRQDR